MADRGHYLREFLDLVNRLEEDGFSREEMFEMLNAAVEHVGGPGDLPYARGTCTNCGAVHVAWSEYQWAQMVRARCRSCGRSW